MTHYYFKFGIGNTSFLPEIINGLDINNNSLGIYFGLANKLRDSLKKLNTGGNINKTDIEKLNDANDKDITRNWNQIKAFIELTNKDYLWLWSNGCIYVYQICPEQFTLKVYNYDSNLKKDKSQKEALSIPVKFKKMFFPQEVPFRFLTLNTNQRYNRKTIVQLDKVGNGIADNLLNESKNKNKIEITEANFLDYLSPSQFESLIFLLLQANDIICSTHFGGNSQGFDFLADSDFKVNNNQIEKLTQLTAKTKIQVKLRTIEENEAYQVIGDNDFLFSKNRLCDGRNTNIEFINIDYHKLIKNSPNNAYLKNGCNLSSVMSAIS